MTRWLLVPLAAFALVGCTVNLGGCFGRADVPTVPAPEPPPLPPADDAKPADPVSDLRAERDRLKADLAGIESRLRAAESEKTLAPLRALTRWAAWIGGVIALASVFGLFLLRVGVGLPVGSRLLVGIGVSGLVLSASAVGLGQALPWIGPAGLGFLVLLVLGGVGWAALTWRKAGQVAASEWQHYAASLPRDLREQLDGYSKARQVLAGRSIPDTVDMLLRGGKA